MKLFIAACALLALSGCASIRPMPANVCAPAVLVGCSNYDGKIEVDPPAPPAP